MSSSSRRCLIFAFTSLSLIASACVYDSEEVTELSEVRRMVPSKVQNEVDRVKALFDKAKPTFDGARVSAPKADVFNTDVDPNAPKKPVFGGTVRIADRAEPKRLTYWLDSSAITSEINKYIFNGLLHEDPVTLELVPDLAESWEREDVVWLKGRHPDSVFERRMGKTPETEDNNYVIGTVVPESVVWIDEAAGEVESLTVIVDGVEQTYTAEDLRVRSNDDGSYRRTFDREVIYSFKLRKGVTFHDGEPFTSEDVMFTLELLNNPKIPEMTAVRASFSSLRHWEALDDYTVKIYQDEAYFKSAVNFADDFSIFPKHVFNPEGVEFTVDEMAKHFVDHPAIDAPVGTGPYAFPSELVLDKYNPRGETTGWQPSNYIKLYRTGDFWDAKRRGYIDEIRWGFYTGGAENILRAMNNLESDFTSHFGSNELFTKTNPIDSPTFNKNYAKFMYVQPSYNFIVFNTRKPYFDDVRVRQAFNMLFDRHDLNVNLSYGTAIEISGPSFIFGPAYDQSIKPYEFNRRRAEELLNEAGWVDTDGDGIRDRDGIPFEVQFLLGTGKSLGETISYIMKEDLESLGIHMELRRLEWQSFLEHVDERKFDLYSLAYITDIESDPYGGFHSSQWAARGQNTSGYNNPEADALILKIRRELDFDKRMTLQHELHALLARDVPKMFNYVYPKRGAYIRRLRNVQFSGRRPNYFVWQWYIPQELQTPEEQALAKKRWEGVPVHPLPEVSSSPLN